MMTAAGEVFRHEPLSLKLAVKTAGSACPYTHAEIVRLAFALPSIFHALMRDIELDTGEPAQFEELIRASLTTGMIVLNTEVVRIGDVVVLPRELDFLKRTAKFRVGFFQSIKDVQLPKGSLWAATLPFRHQALWDALQAIRARKGDFPSLAAILGDGDRERQNVCAAVLHMLTIGDELASGSAQEAFLLGVVRDIEDMTSRDWLSLRRSRSSLQ